MKRVIYFRPYRWESLLFEGNGKLWTLPLAKTSDELKKELDRRRTHASITQLQEIFSHWVSQTSVAYLRRISLILPSGSNQISWRWSQHLVWSPWLHSLPTHSTTTNHNVQTQHGRDHNTLAKLLWSTFITCSQWSQHSTVLGRLQHFLPWTPPHHGTLDLGESNAVTKYALAHKTMKTCTN